MKKIPSKIWYNVMARVFMKDMRVVARSNEARLFIEKYCKNTAKNIIDHGVNLNLFKACKAKDNIFVVCSQLIKRKRIDGIIEKFAEYLKKYNDSYKLYIIGEGELEYELKNQVKELGIEKSIVFTGRMSHKDLIPILSKAKAMLVNTIKDNNMVSIVESISLGTPIVTTDVPLNAEYIKANQLGISKKEWYAEDLQRIIESNSIYVENCIKYRKRISTTSRAEEFISLIQK